MGRAIPRPHRQRRKTSWNACTRVLASLLGATDPLTMAAAGLVMIVTAATASWIPALRATNVDPAVSLRDE